MIEIVRIKYALNEHFWPNTYFPAAQIAAMRWSIVFPIAQTTQHEF